VEGPEQIGMQTNSQGGTASASEVFNGWLARLLAAFQHQRGEAVASLFDDAGHWKDILSFTWEHRTFSGSADIRAGFDATVCRAAATAVRPAAGRTPPQFRRRSGRDVIEGFFDFDTAVGRGTGFVRLLVGAPTSAPRVWLMLTTLQELKGFEERIGRRRASGAEFAMNKLGVNWRDHREARAAFEDRDPEVLVVGAGQAGLSVAARLGLMGVDVLVVEKSPRVGDVWRERYESLTLHNETMANHLPYMPFPDSWPLWLAKDQLGDWLEAYARAMEINVWTSTTLDGASYDEARAQWTVRVRRAGGGERTIRCRHLVLATGVSGAIAHVPELPGIREFQGRVLHSSAFRNGADFREQRVLVVGTGNSGHDVAHDLAVKGAAHVAMLQRGPTCVASLEPTAAMVYKIYADGMPTDDVDLINAAIPYSRFLALEIKAELEGLLPAPQQMPLATLEVA
jgi:thioredoxin reductase